MKSQSRRLYLPVLCALAAAAACSDPSGPEIETALQVRAFARGLEESVSSGGDIQSLEIDRVYVVLGRVKLEKALDNTTDFIDERSVVVQLGAGSQPVLVVASDVPLGSYKELELSIDKLERDHPIEQALIQTYPQLDNASMLVTGTFRRAGGAAESFSFAADIDIDLDVEFQPPLTIDTPQPGTTTLLSLVLDGSSWFRNPSGILIDPTTAANRSMIEASIQKSIELFEDSNRDGHR